MPVKSTDQNSSSIVHEIEVIQQFIKLKPMASVLYLLPQSLILVQSFEY